MTPTRGRFRLHVLLTSGLVIIPLAFAVFLYDVGGGFLRFSGAYTVKALLPTASQLSPDARVTMAGVQVGNVQSIALHGNEALVTMALTDSRVTPIPSDSRVTLRQRTALGENYVEIMPGSSPHALPSSGLLPVSQANPYVDLDQILSLLQGKTRQRARDFFQGIGGALAGRGQALNDTLDYAGQIMENGGQLVRSIYNSRTQLSQLIQQFGDMTREIGDRGATIKTLADRGIVAMNAVASRNVALSSTLDELPSTLASLRTTSHVLTTATDQTAPVFSSLADALDQLRPGIQQLKPASTGGIDLLRQLASASQPLSNTLTHVERLAPPAARALPRLHQLLCQANPFLRYMAPYNREIVGTLVGLGSASNSYDGIGHLIRVTPLLSNESLPGAVPDSVVKAETTLLKSGLFGVPTGFGWDPYPKPGALSNPKDGYGVIGPAQWNGVYPHVVADACTG
ncbi:MAG: MlaD family protein [Solirubrobacteraceae bacterium]